VSITFGVEALAGIFGVEALAGLSGVEALAGDLPPSKGRKAKGSSPVRSYGVEALAGLSGVEALAGEKNDLVDRPDHHPPHIYLDNTWYFITGAIYQKHHLLQPNGHKELVRDRLKALIVEFNLRLAAWVILDNHYHLLIQSHAGAVLSRFFGRLHGRTSFDLNKLDEVRGRHLWHNYWDTCIRSETDYWTRFNYAHHNPVKHGYVAQVEDWPFSSYHYYLKTKGKDWLVDVFRQYPIVDFTSSRDDF
jgi:putative transposase